MSVLLKKSPALTDTSISLPSSKSESNRALVIKAYSHSTISLSNLSPARDTRTMLRLLDEDPDVYDVLDAGTTMRFLTAFCAVMGKKKLLTGTDRMKERPIGLLADALRHLGADISYEGQKGYPPLRTNGFDRDSLVHEVSIRGDVSSQFISALLMAGPVLPVGLTLKLTDKIGSRPYIDMTLALMNRFGATAMWESNDVVRVLPTGYSGGSYEIESDWSGASYWYSLMAIARNGRLLLKGLRDVSMQGDREIANIMEKLGVHSSFTNEGVVLTPGPEPDPKQALEIDFTGCPDLAQTVAVTCTALGIKCTMNGVESLRIKETDRIKALQQEIEKTGESRLYAISDTTCVLQPGEVRLPEKPLFINTYDDHRMAMAFAPLSVLMPLEIEDPAVTAKSYPDFWKDFESAGISLTFNQ
ncbi:3-phosphoshikimate 1-carboxyvinyltransferase [Roseivirga sp. BDSF3-8]|uniref:3-phosphoshikimate 1-carboxyvinyltransferase n=1 Tax=Roseivirga sp. BDSF3-8 TaxID=3241598 RepID=UPI00353255EE